MNGPRIFQISVKSHSDGCTQINYNFDNFDYFSNFMMVLYVKKKLLKHSELLKKARRNRKLFMHST